MEADLIIQVLETYLAPKVAAAGGKLEVCGTPADTLEALNVAPGSFRVILQWGGEDAADKDGASATMDLKVVVQAAKGFKLSKGEDVFKSRSGGRDNFIRICAAMRGWIRQIQFVDPDDSAKPHPYIDCRGFLPQSTKWLAGGLDELAPVREAVLTFAITIAIDHVEAETLTIAIP